MTQPGADKSNYKTEMPYPFAAVLAAELQFIDQRRGAIEPPSSWRSKKDEDKSLSDFRTKALKRARRRLFAQAREKIKHLIADSARRAAAAKPGGGPSAQTQSGKEFDDILKEAEQKAMAEAEKQCEEEVEKRKAASHKKPEQADFLAKSSKSKVNLSAAGGRKTIFDAPATAHEEQKFAHDVLGIARDKSLVGLALSGGGIRSATFNLGLLQGLADLGLLKRIDYLSTVSGGGYIGGWLSAWIHREGSVSSVEKQIRNSRVKQAEGRRPTGTTKVPPVVVDEPDPIHHLRFYSNYLAPRPSLGCADTWVLLAIYLRNLLLNQLVLIPCLMAALLIPRFLLLFYYWKGIGNLNHFQYRFFAIVVTTLLLACFFVTRWIAHPHTEPGKHSIASRKPIWRMLSAVLLPMFLGGLVASWLTWDLPLPAVATTLKQTMLAKLTAQAPFFDMVGGNAPLMFGFFFYATFGLLNVYGLILRRSEGVAPRHHIWWRIVCTVLAAVLGSLLLGSIFFFAIPIGEQPGAFEIDRKIRHLAVVLTIGPPIVLVTYYLATVIWMGLMGNLTKGPEREWWSSLGAFILQWTVMLFVFFGLALFGVPLLIAATPWGLKLLGSGWLTTTAAGVVAGSSARTGKGSSNVVLDMIARAAPYIFLVGLTILLSWCLCRMIDTPRSPGIYYGEISRAPQEPPRHVVRTVNERGETLSQTQTVAYDEEFNHEAQQIRSYWHGIFSIEPAQSADLDPSQLGALGIRWLCWFVGLCVLALLASWRVGVNTFSLQQLYGNRLVRCYLGASRRKTRETVPQGAPTNVSENNMRRPDPLTGFDPEDDLPLSQLNAEYGGPYLIVNAALNLVQDDDLSIQERKASAFTLSRDFAGSRLTHYRPLPWYGSGRYFDRPVTLGEAISISGAAASPNMGYHSSPAVTSLLTLFNVRLGAWMPNPSAPEAWIYREPRMSLVLLWMELLGMTNRRSNYVYLSDGGHFENLGVYELVRRRCRFIIASDAGADPNFDFFDLGGLIRKCRTDLGVPIEIDVTPIKPGDDGHSSWHCALGLVRYDYVDSKAQPGILIYIKNSVSGNEPADVLNYAHEHPAFPHQPTTDQFFSESQFESYRALGQHVALEVFSDAMRNVEWTDEMDEDAHCRVVEPLFSALHRRWFPPPPMLEENYLESVKPCIDLVTDLREDENLEDYSLSLFPELEKEFGIARTQAKSEQRARLDAKRSELHMVEQMLEVMETAYLSVHLEGSQAHPLNRGWMNAFRRWGNSAIVRKHWPTVRGEFSQDFVRFCEDELKLDRGEVHMYLLDLCDGVEASGDWLRIEEEFSAEWPGEVPLELLVRNAITVTVQGSQFRAAWLISVASYQEPWPERWSNDQFPYGVIVLTESPGNDAELFLWIRGAYRNQGIGRECMDHFFHESATELFPESVTQFLSGTPILRLIARLPEANRPGSPNTSQKGLWRSLFYKYEFRMRDRMDANLDRNYGRNSEDIILVRGVK